MHRLCLHWLSKQRWGVALHGHQCQSPSPLLILRTKGRSKERCYFLEVGVILCQQSQRTRQVRRLKGGSEAGLALLTPKTSQGKLGSCPRLPPGSTQVIAVIAMHLGGLCSVGYPEFRVRSATCSFQKWKLIFLSPFNHHPHPVPPSHTIFFQIVLHISALLSDVKFLPFYLCYCDIEENGCEEHIDMQWLQCIIYFKLDYFANGALLFISFISIIYHKDNS